MKHFLLIHGGSHGAWCWQSTIESLRKLGATASALDLPGHGADRTPRETVDRESYLAAIRRVVDCIDSKELVLVGHSLAGILLPQLADELGQRLKQIIFLAAMVCEPGERAIDLVPDERRQSYFDLASTTDDFSVLWPFEKARRCFFNDLTLERARWAYEQLTPQPLQVYLDVVPQSRIRCETRYLICQRDACLPLESTLRWGKRLGVTPEYIDSGHDVMLSNSRDLAKVLLR